MSTGYDQDFYTWTQEQAGFLRQGRFDRLDLGNLAAEVESMGKSEQRALASRLAIIIGHLLKLQFQTERTPTNEKSWRASVAAQRAQVTKLLVQNPGLKNPTLMDDALDSAWIDGRDLALGETGLDPALFPKANPFTLDDLLTTGGESL